MSAAPNCAALLSRSDFDEYDAICDHLLVLDHAASAKAVSQAAKPKVVGTYRLLRQDVADRHFGFYTARRIRHRAAARGHPGLRFLELGRSCVLKPYRNKRTVELLWHGIWAYVLHHRIDVMIGCASLEGTDPDKLALPLSFLHHYARAPEGWRRAGAGRALRRHGPCSARRRSIPKAALQDAAAADQGLSARSAPPSATARWSTASSAPPTCSWCCRSRRISPRYIDHFGPVANRHAA